MISVIVTISLSRPCLCFQCVLNKLIKVNDIWIHIIRYYFSDDSPYESRDHCYNECLYRESANLTGLIHPKAVSNSSSRFRRFPNKGPVFAPDPRTLDTEGLIENYRLMKSSAKSIHDQCSDLCRQPDCEWKPIRDWVPRTGWWRLRLWLQSFPDLTSVQVPIVTLVDFVTYVLSSLGFWFAFSPLVALMAVRKVRPFKCESSDECNQNKLTLTSLIGQVNQMQLVINNLQLVQTQSAWEIELVDCVWIFDNLIYAFIYSFCRFIFFIDYFPEFLTKSINCWFAFNIIHTVAVPPGGTIYRSVTVAQPNVTREQNIGMSSSTRSSLSTRSNPASLNMVDMFMAPPLQPIEKKCHNGEWIDCSRIDINWTESTDINLLVTVSANESRRW